MQISIWRNLTFITNKLYLQIPKGKFICILCKKPETLTNGRRVGETVAEFLLEKFGLESNKDDLICGVCRNSMYNKPKTCKQVNHEETNVSEKPATSGSNMVN